MDAENGREALVLEYLQRHLEENIERIVLEHEMHHRGPVELDVSCVDGEGSGPGDDTLRSRVRTIVDAFHNMPLVRELGIRVHKVTAIDSDGDGRVVVRVAYDYPDDAWS